MRSNCVFWALALWWRLRKPHRRRQARERHLSVRGSRWGPFPHFGVMVGCRDGRYRFVSYKPIAPREKKLPPPLFKGRHRWGDR